MSWHRCQSYDFFPGSAPRKTNVEGYEVWRRMEMLVSCQCEGVAYRAKPWVWLGSLDRRA
jgi:hypothetical protein